MTATSRRAGVTRAITGTLIIIATGFLAGTIAGHHQAPPAPVVNVQHMPGITVPVPRGIAP